MKAFEPSGPIQVIPPGLLGLLQLKSPMGVNPSVLNNDVQPVIDLEKWWMRAREEYIDLATATNPYAPATYHSLVAFGANSPTVPNNEWWYVRNLSGRVYSSGAGTVTRGCRVGYLTPNIGNVLLFGDPMEAIAAGGSDTSLARDFWAPPGSIFGIYLTIVAVANVTLNFTGMTFARCRI